QVLHSRADEIQSGPEALPCFEDALAQATVQWFKREFYHWVDPIKCPTCQGATTMQEMVPPDAEDINGKAGRVELHVCNDRACGGRFRFPRYNDLATLLRSRTGRCGEWANTFTLVLRAIGLRARYVWNAEDHVWNEYFSPTQQRWIHMDSCEAARDEPLLYDKGWGKKMSYILAFSTDGAEDVTRGYVRDWDETLRRRNRGSEEDLAKVSKQPTHVHPHLYPISIVLFRHALRLCAVCTSCVPFTHPKSEIAMHNRDSRSGSVRFFCELNRLLASPAPPHPRFSTLHQLVTSLPPPLPSPQPPHRTLVAFSEQPSSPFPYPTLTCRSLPFPLLLNPVHSPHSTHQTLPDSQTLSPDDR
ncbi:hypothetical protein BOTBODRAFT_107998, partial [Botryobasidium botryosum FD-172 SS1]